MTEWSPRLDILPAPQRHLWPELAATPREFTLYGGTALALHLGHRHSVDFDFFGSRPLDPVGLARTVPFLRGADVIQRDKNTLTVLVDRDGPVKVSFFGVPDLPRLAPVRIAPDIGLPVAELLDLAGTKASVIQLRAEAKDYLDMDALMSRGGISLELALSAAQRLYGPTFNPQITLKALSYFDDGDLRKLPDEVKSRLATAAREVDLDRLPDLALTTRLPEPDRGLDR
jgi:hypothetical protein